MKIALGVEYDGSCYRGWQRQRHDPQTVQAVLEQALSKVADHPVGVICAGRTDTGVHGVGQVVHFETRAQRDMKAWVFGGNSNLPDSISVRWAVPVADDFHARFSARQRSYRYLIYNSRQRPALGIRHLTWNYRPLDVDLMHQAGQYLVGEKDFSSFRAMGCQSKSPVRCITSLKLRRLGDLIVMDVSANAFLQHMVRNIAGVLMAVGSGQQEPQWVKEVLEARDRTKGGVTAPPYGLYFMKVEYPEAFQLPKQPDQIPFLPVG